MGKKRKLGQLEAAQPQPAEPIVVSVDDAEPSKQIESTQSEVLPNPNEVQAKPAEQVVTNPPVPEIESEPAEPPRKKRKKPKKQKQVDICVDVAGEAAESSNPTVGAKRSSNPAAEIEAKPANPVAKSEVKIEELRMILEVNVEAKTEEVAVKKKKKKLREQMEVQSAETVQCGDDVERNCEAKVIEEDEPVKKRKKSKRQKVREVMEVQGTVTGCVDDVEKNGEAKINGVFQKPVQVVAKMKGSKEPVTVCVGVGNNVDGKIDEGGELAKLLAMHGLTTEIMEMQGTGPPCVDGVEKSGEAKIKEAFQRPVHVLAVMEGSKDPVTVYVGVENNVDGKIDERGEVAKLLAIHGLTMIGGEAENRKRKRKETKMENTDITCADVGYNGEGVTMPWLRERQGLVLTSMEWKKRQLILGLQRKAGTEKQKEKKSTEEKVEQEKESRHEKAEEQTIEYPQLCVLCRGKGHIISTCSLLNQTQTNNNKSVKPKDGKASNRKKKNVNAENPKNGKSSNRKKKNGNAEKPKNGKASNRKKKNGNAETPKNGTSSNRKKKNGNAEKLSGCPPENTLVKDKSSDSKDGESVVKNDEAEKLFGCPPMDTSMTEGASGVKVDESTVKNVDESSYTPEDVVMKDETIVRVDCASHPEECHVKPMIEQGPEAVKPVA